MAYSRVVRSDFKGLTALVKSFDEKRVVKLGVFGATQHENERKASGEVYSKAEGGGHSTGSAPAGLTNADLAAVHELGSISRGIPARSFLRMPLHQKTEEIMKEARKGADKLLATGQMVKLLTRLGISCENAVQRAFASGGFGLWKALKAATIRRKHSSRELIDTAQLRRSITSKVEARA